MDGSSAAVSAPERAHELLRRHGRSTTGFQAVYSGLQHYFASPEACVAYADTGSAWVAAGSPIARTDDLSGTIEAFVAAAHDAGRRASFFGMTAEDALGLERIAIGAEPSWDPSAWDETVRRTRSLREQLRRARAKGVAVRAVSPSELRRDAQLRRRIDDLTRRWLDSRRMAPMGFLVEIDLYQASEDRCYFVAERGAGVVGLLVAVPIYGRQGWFFEDLLRAPDAPNGTAERLFDAAMRSCLERGAREVSMGLAPLAQVPEGPLRWIRDRSAWLYDFEGLYRFKAKLRPRAWEPLYLAYPRGDLAAVVVLDSLRAFARGSLARFALATAVHRARGLRSLA